MIVLALTAKATSATKMKMVAYYHLPGLFEFYSFYARFLPLYKKHREYFYDWCEIGSIYGAPKGCLWDGGRNGFGQNNPMDVFRLMETYGISARLTFSNSLLEEKDLLNPMGNALCSLFEKETNGIIIHSDLLLKYIQEHYPKFYFVSSTTKVLTDFQDLKEELNRKEFSFVVPDFRLNPQLDRWNTLSVFQKQKVEFLCNECCMFGCADRKACYESVSRKNLNKETKEWICKSKETYRFSKAMENPGFIGVEQIQNAYMPMGFRHFKIEGRSLGSALLLEFILYYMTKPECQLKVREEMYLENTLDLF